ncbi:MAG TPA: hypothetical protein DD490_24535 [Acidobacteria bacterium]|nr:hypothetical protein [Acidobacteriota bacterium]
MAPASRPADGHLHERVEVGGEDRLAEGLGAGDEQAAERLDARRLAGLQKNGPKARPLRSP